MKKTHSRVVIIAMLVFVILAGFFLKIGSVSYASASQSDINAAVRDWLGNPPNSSNYRVDEREYREGRVNFFAYGLLLPNLPDNLIYTEGVGLSFKETDEDGNYTGNTTIANLAIELNVNGKMMRVPVNGNTLIRTDDGYKLLFASGKTSVDAPAYYKPDDGGRAVWISGDRILLYDGTTEAFGYELEDFEHVSISRVYTYTNDEVDTATSNISDGTAENIRRDRVSRSVWAAIGSWFAEIWEDIKAWAMDKISGIFNELCHPIAKTLHELINAAFNGRKDRYITIDDIVFNRSPKLDINFWEEATVPAGGIPPVKHSLSRIVSFIYNYLSGLAILVAIILFLYNGLRILLSSTGKGLEEAKSRMIDWAMGIVIIFFFPYVMLYTVKLNEAIVGLIDNPNGTSSVETDGVGLDTMRYIAALSGKDKSTINVTTREVDDEGNITERTIRRVVDGLNSFPLTIVYLIMDGQLLVLIIMYYRRAFIIGFLIAMFPVVAAYSLWEKIHKGRRTSATALD
jgi:fumarate reductase subunit D